MTHVKPYDRKNAMVVTGLINERAVTFYDEDDLPRVRILTDQGTGYCRNREHHVYQSYLIIEDIDHSRTKAKSPQVSGICERFYRTMQEGRIGIALRKKTTLKHRDYRWV